MKHTILILLSACMALAACRQQAGIASYSEAERQTVDSIVRNTKGIDALQTLVANYRMSGNMLGQIVALRQLGKACREQSMFAEAIDSHRQGLQLAAEVADTLEMVQALNNIGTNYRRLGSLEEAASFHQQAIVLTTQMNDQTSLKACKNRVISLNGMGNVLMSLGNLEQADSIFRLALVGERQMGSKLGEAINLANLGSIKEQLGMADSARIYYQWSLKMNEQAGSKLGIALCHIHFGELSEHDGQLDDALAEYRTAFDILHDNSDDWHWLESVLNIARIYIKEGKTAEARTQLDLAQQTVDRIGSQDHQVQVYELYYMLYEKMGNLRLALDNYIRMNTLSDSLLNTKKLTNIQNQQLSSERLRRQHELQLTESRLAREQSEKKTMLVAVIAILLLALAVVGLMWYHLRSRTTHHRLAQQLQQSREELYADLAQNVQTPLTLIIGLGQQLERHDASDAEKTRSAARQIVRQGNSLLDLMKKMQGVISEK